MADESDVIGIRRIRSNEVCTIGELYLDGRRFCYTLEDPVREKKIPGITAIPKGIYPVVIDHSPKFGRELPHLLDVPGFTGIRIHSGNIADETFGCILVGLEYKDNTLLHSISAMNALLPIIEEKLATAKLYVNITEDFHV